MAKNKGSKHHRIPTDLIAPCGMNCRLCYAFEREKNPCPGCRGDDSLKMKSCLTCNIKNCELIAGGTLKICHGCEFLPCTRLKNLDKRYRSKYGMSMLENLKTIEAEGISSFIRKEIEKWSCPECGELLCVHKPACEECGYKWNQAAT